MFVGDIHSSSIYIKKIKKNYYNNSTNNKQYDFNKKKEHNK